MPTLYILCGPSGCGKSTWAHNFMKENDELRYVSRDEIRYSLLKEGEGYFAHEKEVFKKFANTIRQTLVDGFDVIADATHLTEFSRRKLTQAIDQYYTDYQIIYVAFRADADICVLRNNQRSGHANIPDNIVRNMCRDYRAPVLDEDERVIQIIEVSELQ